MKKYLAYIAGIAAVVVLFSACAKSPVSPIFGAKDGVWGLVDLMNGMREVIVTYTNGDRAWAEYQMETVINWLPAAERYLNAPLPNNYKIILCGVDEVYDFSGNSYGGINYISTFNDYISLSYSDSEIGRPALAQHETTHYWFHSGVINFEGVFEGICNFMQIAAARDGYIAPTPQELFYMTDELYTFYFDAVDEPINENYSQDSRGYFYNKATKLQYLLYKELGANGYQAFLRQILNFEPITKLDSVVDILNTIKARDWKTFLSGWLYDGAYSSYSMDDFIDDDHDRLSDIDEIYGGTYPNNSDSDDDLIPDGDEVRLGLNPNGANAIADVVAYGPFADGDDAEWDYIPNVSVKTDSETDCVSAYFNITNIVYKITNDYFYVLVQTQSPPQLSDAYRFGVAIDSDLNSHSDVVFSMPLDRHNLPRKYDYSSDEYSNPYNLYAEVNSSGEMAIPLSEIGSDSFKFFVYYYNSDADSYLDYSSWIASP